MRHRPQDIKRPQHDPRRQYGQLRLHTPGGEVDVDTRATSRGNPRFQPYHHQRPHGHSAA